jgi:hypothetical protein
VYSTPTQSIAHVDSSGGALEDTKGLDNRRRHTILRLVDLEVTQRAVSSQKCTGAEHGEDIGNAPLGLGTPVLVICDLVILLVVVFKVDGIRSTLTSSSPKASVSMRVFDA